jgi:hypothetical protein
MCRATLAPGNRDPGWGISRRRGIDHLGFLGPLTDDRPETRERITACLIVQNEQERLAAALASVAFCDEVIVIDGGSSDGTVALARAAGARVIESPWPGFAAQRNIAIDAAATDWILEVDADERISEPLRESILGLLSEPPPGAAMAVFALRNRFLGGLLGPSAKYPAYRSRLFRRSVYRHDEGRAVHEGIELRERPVILAGDLEHELAATLREALRDMWSYARLESVHVPRPSSPAGYVKGLVLRPAAKLVYRTVIDGGWRDGWRGLVKISLDVSSDVIVWALVLTRRSAPGGDGHGPGDEHFGRRRVGPVKIVAVAAGERSRSAALARLELLRERGADVALISPAPAGADGVPGQTLGRFGPLGLIRALEAEMHVRPIDAVSPFGRRAKP